MYSYIYTTSETFQKFETFRSTGSVLTSRRLRKYTKFVRSQRFRRANVSSLVSHRCYHQRDLQISLSEVLKDVSRRTVCSFRSPPHIASQPSRVSPNLTNTFEPRLRHPTSHNTTFIFPPHPDHHDNHHHQPGISNPSS